MATETVTTYDYDAVSPPIEITPEYYYLNGHGEMAQTPTPAQVPAYLFGRSGVGDTPSARRRLIARSWSYDGIGTLRLGQIPEGYDPDRARQLAPAVSADITSRCGSPAEAQIRPRPGGCYDYNRSLLRDFQTSAAIDPDGLYGPMSESALQFYGVTDAPLPLFAGGDEVPPYIPPDQRGQVEAEPSVEPQAGAAPAAAAAAEEAAIGPIPPSPEEAPLAPVEPARADMGAIAFLGAFMSIAASSLRGHLI